MAGRPRKKLDKKRIEKLASMGLTVAECAVIEGVNKKTIERRAMPAIHDGRERMTASLKRKQFEIAMSGNPTMLIWLGKNYLNQSDKKEITGADGKDLFSFMLVEAMQDD